MAELGAKKKQRNYFLDLLKALGCLLAIMVHYVLYVGPALGVAARVPGVANPELQTAYLFFTFTKLWGLSGLGAISVFTFGTGYWFVDAFKKEQRRNTFGRGKDVSIVGKYALKNYAAYWPYVLFGVLWHIIVLYAVAPELKFFSETFVNQIILAVPHLLGFKFMGIAQAPGADLTSGAAAWLDQIETLNGTAIFTNWNGPLWYIMALLYVLPLYYAVFMKSEAFGVFGLTTSVFVTYCVSGSITNAGMYSVWNQGFFDSSLFRLGGPIAFGIWGWYIVDFLKKKEFSKKEKTAMNIFAAISIIWVIYQAIESPGGFLYHDIAWTCLLIAVMTEKDAITTGINKGLNKIPAISKHFAFLSLSVFLLHCPVFYAVSLNIQRNIFPAVREFYLSNSFDFTAFVTIAVVYLLCIPFYFFDKYVLKKLTKWLLTFTKATEPVVIEAPAEAK